MFWVLVRSLKFSVPSKQSLSVSPTWLSRIICEFFTHIIVSPSSRAGNIHWLLPEYCWSVFLWHRDTSFLQYLCGFLIIPLFNKLSRDLAPAFLNVISHPHVCCVRVTPATWTSPAVCPFAPQCHFPFCPTTKNIFLCLVFMRDTTEVSPGGPSWGFIKGHGSLFLSVPVASGMAPITALLYCSVMVLPNLSSLP